MRKVIATSMVLVLALLLIPSCAAGVPQEEYNRVSSDLAAAQTQIQSLQADLAAKESELDATREKMEQAKTAAEIINVLFVPVLKGEESAIDPLSFLFEWRDKVEATGDAVMQEKFQAVIDSGGGDEELTNFLLYLFESIPKVLE